MKKSFVLYTDYMQHIQLLDTGQKADLLDAIFAYADSCEVKKLDSITNMAFSFIRSQMDRDSIAYQDKIKKRSECGRIGGLAKASKAKQNVAKASKAKQTLANLADTVTDNVTVTETEEYKSTPHGVLVDDDIIDDQKQHDAEDANRGGSESGWGYNHSKQPDCQFAKMVELYHEALPGHPRVEVDNHTRRKHAKARWMDAARRLKEKGETVTLEALIGYFRRYFAHAARSQFLTGQVAGSRGPFFADFDFLISPKGFAGIIEGKYHRENS